MPCRLVGILAILDIQQRAFRLGQELSRRKALGAPRFVVAPGRINILGEHTDTSGGFSLPAAVDRNLLCAFVASEGARIRAVSLDVSGIVELDEHLALVEGSASFGRYVAAVATILAEKGIRVSGLDLALSSTIPNGGGMSSSAALCVALTMAMTAAGDSSLAPLETALVAQAAEHRVGVRCGLMDQYVITHGQEGHALLLDSRAQSHQSVPLQLENSVFVVGDTCTHRGLVDSEYNARRSQVEEAACILDGGQGRIRSLRDATSELLQARHDELGPLLFRRATHVVGENARTLAAARLLTEAHQAGQSHAGEGRSLTHSLGRLLDASHASLRDFFEVSCPELDALVIALREQGDEYVQGARMMGGGFGGCVIALVSAESLPRVLGRAGQTYRKRTGKKAAFFSVAIGSGARFLSGDASSPL